MMRYKLFALIFSTLLMVFVPVVHSQEKGANPLKFSAELFTGYNRGYGIRGNLTAKNFEKGFPFDLRFGIGYTFLNPGNAADARRIFVNNATNGTPEKKGHTIDYRLDFLIPKTIFKVENSYLILGPRFSTFLGDFKYVGGNEDFEVRSHQWGLGGDIEHHFRMVKNIDFVLNYGLDFYFPSTLTGHDTSYSPDNDNVNPKNDNENNDAEFRYKDADEAINQPKIMPHIMLGVSFNLSAD